MKRKLAAILVALSLGFAPAQVAVQLILDASGSMFKRLDDGRYRIVAAKDVLANLIGALPASDDLDVGLRVYGAQSNALDEGACTDSELVVPMEGFDRSALLDAVRDTQARGATPIAYSLERAIEDLEGIAGSKVVVLVTDGLESCGGDVAEVAARLIASGADVDLRIIGFDLTEDAAANFQGIGTFENARSAEELAAALGRALEPATEPSREEAFDVTVRVIRGGEPAEGATVTFVSAVTGEQHPLAPVETGKLTATLPPGAYRADLADALSDRPLTVANVLVTPDGENVFTYELAQASEVELTVTPADPVAGGNVTVAYRGALQAEDSWITVVPTDAPDDVYLDWTYAEGEFGSVQLGTPPEPTDLEARFYVELPEGGTRLVGRSGPFTSVQPVVSVQAHGEVLAGSEFSVAWTGPDNDGDYVTIVPAGADQGAYLSYEYTAAGSPVALTAPLEPGDYEVRYVAGQGDAPTLASQSVSVAQGEYGIEAPAEVAARTAFEVTWTGPNNPMDYITVVPAGAPEGTYTSYAYTAEGNPVELTAPPEPGLYEVRYTTDQSPNPTLASIEITVSSVEYGVQAPAKVSAGEAFDVSWTGLGASDDYITIVPVGAEPGAYLDYQYTSAGNPVTLTAPDEPGAYEVRYQTDEHGVFASRAITVE